jgi:hypothetical protein
MGRTLGLPFMAITGWGDRWLGGGFGPLTLRSRSTGRKVRVAYVDENDRTVAPSDVSFEITGKKAKRISAVRRRPRAVTRTRP